MDEARCLDAAGWFDLVSDGGVVVDIALANTAPTGTLAPGTWFTVAGASCDELVVQAFEVVQ